MRTPTGIGRRPTWACVCGSPSSAPEDLDRVTGGERDDGPLLVGTPTPGPGAAVALALARAVHRVHVRDGDAEDLLDRLLDLDLVGTRRDLERVDVRVQGGVGLLRHDRSQDHVSRVHASSSVAAVGGASSSLASDASAGAAAAASVVAGAPAAPSVSRLTMASSVPDENTSQSLTSTS